MHERVRESKGEQARGSDLVMEREQVQRETDRQMERDSQQGRHGSEEGGWSDEGGWSEEGGWKGGVPQGVQKARHTHTHTHTDSEEMPPPLSIPVYPRELRVQPLPLMEVETRECDMGGVGASREVVVSGMSMSIDSGRFSGKSIP